MSFQYKDGGRKDSGYKGEVRDCVVRAIAIATEKPYQEVYDAINVASSEDKAGHKSSARNGVYRAVWEKYLKSLGWTWKPTMLIGQGCKVHLVAHELPAGRIIARVSKHMVAVIDGVINDTHDPSREGKRCVYGFWAR